MISFSQECSAQSLTLHCFRLVLHTKLRSKQLKMLLPSSFSKGKGILPLLLRTLKIYDLWNIVPYQYSKKLHKFQVKSQSTQKTIWKKFALVISFTAISLLQTLHIKHAILVPHYLQCWFYILFSSCGCYMSYDQLTKCHDIVALLNGMLMFEQTHKQGTLNRRKIK